MVDFRVCQTRFIPKFWEPTGMEHCNYLPIPTKVEAPISTDANGSEAKRRCPNSCASVIGMMFYLASNTRTGISFAVYQYAWFTHNIKSSY